MVSSVETGWNETCRFFFYQYRSVGLQSLVEQPWDCTFPSRVTTEVLAIAEIISQEFA